ncbi:outer membrane beta-barrel protein [Myxococcota bacterium]|nr:outer membrane beta-barrel protein [Myxococcota bacterium]
MPDTFLDASLKLRRAIQAVVMSFPLRRIIRAIQWLSSSLLLTSLTAAAWAQDSAPFEAGSHPGRNEYVSTGGYAVIGGLNGFAAFQNDQGQSFDGSYGFLLKGGARFNPYLAVEFEGNFLSGFKTQYDISQHPNYPGSGLPPTVGLTVEGGNVTANVVAYFPLGRIQPKVMVGIGGMWAGLRSTDSVGAVCTPGYPWDWYCSGRYARLGNSGGYGTRFGGGGDIEGAEDWAIVLESSYIKPFGALEDLTYVNLGWGIRFNF